MCVLTNNATAYEDECRQDVSKRLCILFQVTDYAIARRIVDLHSRIENSVERVYSLDEIRRYLLFARQFKPKVSDRTTHLHSS